MNSNFRADRQRGTSKGDWEEIGKEVGVKQGEYVIMKMKRIEFFFKKKNMAGANFVAYSNEGRLKYMSDQIKY